VNCATIRKDSIAEQYLNGSLRDDLLTAYEHHYFQCDACFGELQKIDEIRRALAKKPVVPAPPRKTKRFRASPWAWQAFAGLAATLTIVAVVLQEYRSVPLLSTPGAGRTGAEQAAVQVTATPGPSRSIALARLAIPEPPSYVPQVVRSTEAASSAAFRQGMAAYTAGNYVAAAEKLHRAANINPSRPDIAFFIAASELLAGNPVAATTGFRSVLALGENAFTDEAYYYLAKAQLALGDTDAAKLSLEQVSRSEVALREEADRLLQQIDELPAY
jgi:tetratricopeptide (TPR) repeat protein